VYILRWAARIWVGVLVAAVLLVGLLLALRLILPLLESSPPALVQAIPADGAGGVLPRSRLTLRFNMPMNRRSVAGALRIDPPLAAVSIWSGDARTLTISPTQALRPDTTYRLVLGADALSRLFRASAKEQELSFRTAPAPAVLALLPPDGSQNVAIDMPISIRFSRMIVPTDTLDLATRLPELRFDPPIDGSATWLDPATVLFRPSAELQPGTRYRATLDARLADLGGGELGRDVSWSFSTTPPSVLMVDPPVGGRWVAPRTPLTLRLSHALDLATISSSFAVTPTVEGAWPLRPCRTRRS
jgi:hypothetical protein